MEGDVSHSFRFKPYIAWDVTGIIYKEGDRILDIEIERISSKFYDYAFDNKEHMFWTIPNGLLISTDEQREIVNRLVQWCKSKKIRLEVCIPRDPAEIEKEYRDKGWDVERLPNGVLHLSKDVSKPVTADARGEGVFAAIRRLFCGSKRK